MRALYVFEDPMCVWCYAVAPQLDELFELVPSGVEIKRLPGVLAGKVENGALVGPDTSPMEEGKRKYVMHQWENFERLTGRKLNWELWERGDLRRSTYEACAAVAAAGKQDLYLPMFEAVQRAFYQQARNTSDAETLMSIARGLGAGGKAVDMARFERDFSSKETAGHLQQNFAARIGLGERLKKYRHPESGHAIELPSFVLAEGSAPYDLATGSGRESMLCEGSHYAALRFREVFGK